MTTTRKEGLFCLVNLMINEGVKSLAIISHPDYNGGYREALHFSMDECKDWHENLDRFEYVEWVGRPIDLLKDMPTLHQHIEPFHEEPRDYEWEWWEDWES